MTRRTYLSSGSAYRPAPTSLNFCRMCCKAASSLAACSIGTVDLGGVPDGYRAMFGVGRSQTFGLNVGNGWKADIS
jgi:hypothetical protein